MLDSMMETWKNAGMDAEMMLESMVTQWKAAGINPDMMLNQLKNTPSPDALYTQEMKSAQEEALASFFSGEEDDDLDMPDPLTNWEDDSIPLTTNSDTSEISDIKAFACGANLSFLNGSFLNSLTTLHGDSTKDDVEQMLEAHWDIDSRVSLLETIQWLNDEGHRGYWKKIWLSLQKIPREEWSLSSHRVAYELAVDGANPETVKEYTENLIEGISQISSLGLLENHTSWNCATWDYGRAINLCRWGFDVGYLNRDEALEKIRKIAEKLYSQYNSWNDLSMGYLLGFVMWNCDPYSLNKLIHGHYLLLNESKSPWQLIDWK